MYKFGLARVKLGVCRAENAESRLAAILFACLLLQAFPFPAAASIRTYIDVATGIPSNLAIDGPGYFLVRDPSSSTLYATRLGEFMVDPFGALVDGYGNRVQGFTNAGFTQIGDLFITPQQMPQGAAPWATLTSFAIETNGKINLTLSDGTTYAHGQVALQNFASIQNLQMIATGDYAFTDAAGPLPQPVIPGTGGLGALLPGQVEIGFPRLDLAQFDAGANGLADDFLTVTGIGTDFAIEGNGFLILRDTNSSALYATRAGACYLDRDGYLVNYAAMRLQGFTDPGFTILGDIQITTNGIPGLDSGVGLTSFTFDWSGRVYLNMSDGTTFQRGQILLEECSRADLLVRTNFGLYPVTNAAMWTKMTAPRTGDFGWLIPGAAQLSQFDVNILAMRARLNFFPPGPIKTATNATDLAINGNGFFILRDPAKNVLYATRVGAFHVDAGSNLVDAGGLRVQGFTNYTQTGTGDIVIDTAGAPSGNDAAMANFAIDGTGEIEVNLANGSEFVRAQVLLQNFRDLQALVPCPNQLYSNYTAALPLYAAGIPGTGIFGTIQSGALEIIPSIPALRLPPKSGLRLMIHNISPLWFAPLNLECSADLQSWDTVCAITNSVVGDAEIFVTNSPSAPRMYYRIH